ncbi:MAG: MerR family transcriptional regulator [Candidatus Fermentithermobacillus carboniphilus]|uniref:MerR family transcriptional regulator n=1 Tax=Candidatus Fermentithermobacillus carboniphilus TaxID=3085328 RepID=A0AAT9LAX4_9FIRM|nr:MAG: MerR family transcriptional regulator [Candidatus Fermentithermobacillus carboniphilus]
MRGKDIGVSEVRNCKRCGKVFISRGSYICPECLQKEEEQFEIVKKYLAENPRATVKETSENTKVPVEVITEFMRKGLLISVLPGEGNAGLSCAICKRPIQSGKICPECERALFAKGLSGGKGKNDTISEESVAVVSEQRRAGQPERMYTFDLIRRKRT